MIRALPFLVVLALAASCGGGDDPAGGACGAGPSLTILAPVEGEAIDMTSDADGTMPGLQYDIVVHACNIFSTGSQIEVWETESLMTRYAVLDTASDDDTAHAVVPLVPGSLTFEARTVDGLTLSEPVSVTVTIP